MEYSIQELSRLSEVTTRTLRWYDQIGLLKPIRRAESGCRYYGRAEVERERLEKLIQSVKDTIGAEEREEFMSDEQKFEAFKLRAVAHNEDGYGAELHAGYGDGEVDEANAAVMHLTQEQCREWICLGQELQERLGSRRPGRDAPRRGGGERDHRPPTAGGSPWPEISTTRPSTGGLRSSM